MKNTQIAWSSVSDLMKQNTQKQYELGRYTSYLFYKTPRRWLHSLSYYKFAAKMIGKGKKVLDFGCSEGLGTYLLSQECGFAKGIDFDEEAIATAQNNFQGKNIEFVQEDFLQTSSKDSWDAITSFDVIEHIMPDRANLFFERIQEKVSPHGITIIGTPSAISQEFASPISKAGHVNIYTPERLEATMRNYFTHVFLFAAHDEVVHTGFLPLAHYLIAVGCKKK
jgi:2-polyprenyl-3-methyl-5-hydroxy-6-metoxy-1,4-benzoquinol methylase